MKSSGSQWLVGQDYADQPRRDVLDSEGVSTWRGIIRNSA